MDVENTPEVVPVESPDEANENTSADPSTPNLKGVKRVATTPPEKDVKKQKVEKMTGFFKNSRILQLSPEPSPQSVEVLDGTPRKDGAGPADVSITPKTPKMSKEEREKLKKERLEEKERQRAERERIAEEKRVEKEKLAEEKRLEKEKKEKERIEKKAEEDRKKEEKRKEAEEKKRKEEEDRVKKEEEKNKKRKEEEEKKEAKRKEEEEKKEAKRKEEEAAEEKKRRESARFLGFFKKEKKKAPVEVPETSSWYRPFERKDGMTLAPITQRAPLPEDYDIWGHQSDDVTIRTFIDAAAKLEISKPNPMKAKLFQFHENRRPWYYGTWRKSATAVRGWCPLAEEAEGIDYDVDSDEEWEDEPSDCEECNSDDDGDKDEEDENEEDDGFFVPPCYLSDGEGEEDSTDTEGRKIVKKTKRVAIDSDEDDDDEASNETEERKARMAQRASEWSKRTEKKKINKLEPRAIGPVYPPSEAPAEFGFMAAVHFY